MTWAAIIGALLTIGGQLLSEYLKHAPERKKTHDALTTRSLDELDAGIERVRGELSPVQPSGRDPGV